MDQTSDSAGAAGFAGHGREEDYDYPPPGFIGNSNFMVAGIRQRFDEGNFPDCFSDYGELLPWNGPWRRMLDTSKPPFVRLFVGGELHVCVNCGDPHHSRGCGTDSAVGRWGACRFLRTGPEVGPCPQFPAGYSESQSK